MAPLFVLLVFTTLARAVGALGVGYVASWPAATAVGLAAMFIVTGASHWDCCSIRWHLTGLACGAGWEDGCHGQALPTGVPRGCRARRPQS